jgi:hypothetical protein
MRYLWMAIFLMVAAGYLALAVAHCFRRDK